MFIVWVLVLWLTVGCFSQNVLLKNKRAVVGSKAKKWINGTIPYYIDVNVFNEEEVVTILEAIEAWNFETCVRFRPRYKEDENWVKITTGKNCHSDIGMVGIGEQKISLAPYHCRYYGTYLHQLGYVIGLHHEHYRPNRDEHINQTNIKKEHKISYNKNNKTNLDDLQSVMYYGRQMKNRSYYHLRDEMYNKDLSFYDVKVVNLFYQCSSRCAAKVICKGDGFVDQFCQCHTKSSFEDRRCRDRNPRQWCKEKYKSGQCEVEEAYMSVRCRKTCGKCHKYGTQFRTLVKKCKNFKKDDYCDKRVQKGDCIKNKQYMKLNCQKACKLCVENKTDNSSMKCRDKLSTTMCEKFVKNGHCRNNTKFTVNNCTKSCKMCKLKDDKSNLCKVKDICNKCRLNPLLLNEICEKSCKTCSSVKTRFSTNSSCLLRVSKGECKTNFEFMLLNCPTSCKYGGNRSISTSFGCMDIIPVQDCMILKQENHCNVSKTAKEQCSKSCGLCQNKISLKTDVGCKDTLSETMCKRLHKEGKCISDKKYMIANCNKSCGFCQITPIFKGCRNLENETNCKRWSRWRNCTKDPHYLMVQCAKSCSRCTNQTYPKCKDLYDEDLCKHLQHNEMCHKRPDFMLHQCAKTCASCDVMKKGVGSFICRNKLPDNICQLWKTDGECQTNKIFMMEYCGKTCGSCQPWASTCENIYTDKLCKQWKNQGFCTMKRPLMKIKCPKICGFCTGNKNSSKNCGNIYNDNICESWKDEGKCVGNNSFIRLVCERSCGYCQVKNGTIHRNTTIQCKNIGDDEHCKYWTNTGKCKQASFYMLKMCAQSCGNCSEYLKLLSSNQTCKNIADNKKCDDWSRDKECQKNPQWMLANCAKSCGYCLDKDSKTNTICVKKDNDNRCNLWKTQGECQKNPQWMLVNCVWSCNDCGVLSKSTTKSLMKTTIKPKTLAKCENIYQDRICEAWKERRLCQKNPIFMSSFCRKSCKKCSKFLECQNAYKNEVCQRWAIEGMCRSNIKFMLALCIKSCGWCPLLKYEMKDLTCQNQYGEMTCEALKAIGWCQTNDAFMRDKCSKSCNVCGISIHSNTKPNVGNSCSNIYEDQICEELAQGKQCQMEPNYVPFVCARSCKSCGQFKPISNDTMTCKNTIKNKDCEYLRRKGECEKNATNMLDKCAMSCRFCQVNVENNSKSVTNGSSCNNIAGDLQCSYWTRQNLCKLNPDYMGQYCKKSCDKCPTNLKIKSKCRDKYIESNCQLWANIGECDINKAWMASQCAKSCRICHI